ncbi:HTH-type transcriptional activator IlvY [Thiospirochaeta perfilievii]|uniref:HTH-type transcriptional activator IlvY n=1 Tax=Thiospirochaeta perfilievii TaxID=252967 RepID=A0A5C1QD99_9SPIO|nr:HTH-type transcriptional activator IlvY [Thiospirochaeta perfilievii]QEN05541.1 HTH-type transcriptional activator IlvY [Thiospirochaeta perfilievii]
MDIRELKLFLKLAETLHYARTSQVMAISPSALSRTVQRLEDEVGEKLFERDNRSVSLTPQGAHFRDYAKDVIERWSILQETLQGESDVVSGEITVYSSVTACYEILPPILKKLRELHPDVHLNLITGSVNEAFAQAGEGVADIVISAEPDNLPATLEFFPIISTPMVFIAPKFDENFKVDITSSDFDPTQTELILPNKSLFRKRIDDWFFERGIKPESYSEASGNEGILAMSKLGFGVGIVPKVVVDHSFFGSEMTVVESDMKPFNVGLLIQKRRLSNPIVKAFLDISNMVKEPIK